MNKNKKIISTSLALALGVSLLIPNTKANEEKTVEKALKEPVKTSEKANLGEKSALVKEENNIKKSPAKEGEETPADGEEKAKNETEKPAEKQEKPAGGEEKPAEKQEKPAGGQEKPKENQTEKPKTDEEKPKEENKAKPKEYKMSEFLNEKGAFEKSKQAELNFLRFEIYNEERNEMGPHEEVLRKMKLQYEKLPKATTWEEMGKILGYNKEYFVRSLLSMKGEKDAYDQNLVKIIDDMANQKPQNPKTDTEKTKEEKKIKAKEFKMSEIFDENAFEFLKNDAIKTFTEYPGIYTNKEMEEFKRKANLLREAKSIDEILKITGWKKEQLAKNYLLHKGIINYVEYSSDLIKIIDDTMNPSQKNPIIKNKKTSKTNTENTTNTANTGNKVSNVGENVQTGVGSLSAVLGLLGASSLGLFKSKRK